MGRALKQVFKPGWPPSPTRGVSVSKIVIWMDSPGSEAPPPGNSPDTKVWTPRHTSPATDEYRERIQQELHHRREGEIQIPSTRPAGCLHTRSCLLTRASAARILDCFPATSTSHSRSPGAPIRTLSTPTFHQRVGGKTLMHEKSRLTSTACPPPSPSSPLGRTLKRQSRRHPGYFINPTPQAARPSLTRTPTRFAPGRERNLTTTSLRSAPGGDSNPNYTPTMKSVKRTWRVRRQRLRLWVGVTPPAAHRPPVLSRKLRASTAQQGFAGGTQTGRVPKRGLDPSLCHIQR